MRKTRPGGWNSFFKATQQVGGRARILTSPASSPGRYSLACTALWLISAHVQGYRLAAHKLNLVPRWVLLDPPCTWKKKFLFELVSNIKKKKRNFTEKSRFLCSSRKNNKRTWQSWVHIPMWEELARAALGLSLKKGWVSCILQVPHPACFTLSSSSN